MPPPTATTEGRVVPVAASRLALQCVMRLRRRDDFLRAAQARRQGTPGCTLQARARGEGEADKVAIRIGFTCSKKLGNAVARNRAKRRLRALAGEVIAARGLPGWDYVLVGRPVTTATLPFATMRGDLERAIDRVHRAAPTGPRQPKR